VAPTSGTASPLGVTNTRSGGGALALFATLLPATSMLRKRAISNISNVIYLGTYLTYLTLVQPWNHQLNHIRTTYNRQVRKNPTARARFTLLLQPAHASRQGAIGPATMARNQSRPHNPDPTYNFSQTGFQDHLPPTICRPYLISSTLDAQSPKHDRQPAEPEPYRASTGCTWDQLSAVL